MNDKELLTLAAKAMGFSDEDLVWVENDETIDGMYVEYFTGFLVGDYHYHFNPLEDDGDAFRLAVRHHISFCRNDDLVFADIQTDPSDPDRGWAFTENTESDPYKAARRAIVRAAAEIGKSL